MKQEVHTVDRVNFYHQHPQSGPVDDECWFGLHHSPHKMLSILGWSRNCLEIDGITNIKLILVYIRIQYDTIHVYRKPVSKSQSSLHGHPIQVVLSCQVAQTSLPQSACRWSGWKPARDAGHLAWIFSPFLQLWSWPCWLNYLRLVCSYLRMGTLIQPEIPGSWDIFTCPLERKKKQGFSAASKNHKISCMDPGTHGNQPCHLLWALAFRFHAN